MRIRLFRCLCIWLGFRRGRRRWRSRFALGPGRAHAPGEDRGGEEQNLGANERRGAAPPRTAVLVADIGPDGRPDQRQTQLNSDAANIQEDLRARDRTQALNTR